MPDPTAPTSEILNRAADLIEVDGWWQHGSKAPGTCVSNAIQGVANRYSWTYEAESVARDRLMVHIGALDLGALFAWNDAPDRTASEVIEVLRACAVIEASRERQAVEVSA